MAETSNHLQQNKNLIPRGIEDAAPYNFPGTPDRVVGADAYIRPRYALPFHCRGDVGIAPYNFPETSVRVVGAGSPGPG